MSTHRILSIDTGYDRILKLFSTSRKRHYKSLDEDTSYQIVQLSGFGASRENFLEQCQLQDSNGTPFYNFLTISSHGSGDHIYNRELGEEVKLLSEEDSNEVFRQVGMGRVIYILACKSGGGALVDKLKSNGAEIIVGFSEEPSWGSHSGNELWRSIDRRILSCFSAPDFIAALNDAISKILSKIDNDLQSSDVQYTRDLKRTRSVIESIVIT